MARVDGRMNADLREIKITRNYIMHAEGSVLIEMGNTKIICNATVEESVPRFKKNSGEGWISAEYSMLPRATTIRNQRDISKLRQNPRSVEIQRLIGRALRAGVDLKLLGERMITVDCDVIQADGGTRCAAISGGFIALYDAIDDLLARELLKTSPIKSLISAVSVGVVNNEELLDLCYIEDSSAEVDMNIIMNDKNEFVEIQGTAEQEPFNYNTLNKMLELAMIGNNAIIQKQKKILGWE